VITYHRPKGDLEVGIPKTTSVQELKADPFGLLAINYILDEVLEDVVVVR